MMKWTELSLSITCITRCAHHSLTVPKERRIVLEIGLLRNLKNVVKQNVYESEELKIRTSEQEKNSIVSSPLSRVTNFDMTLISFCSFLSYILIIRLIFDFCIQIQFLQIETHELQKRNRVVDSIQC